MFNGLLTGPKCHVCGMAQANSQYTKDEYGRGIYWANPDICEYTDVRLDFCGVYHSVEWWDKQLEARKNVTPGN